MTIITRRKVKRCKATGNPCGTDTWKVGFGCKCTECMRYVCNQIVNELNEDGLRDALKELECIRKFHCEKLDPPIYGGTRFVGTVNVIIDSVQKRPDLIIEEDE